MKSASFILTQGFSLAVDAVGAGLFAFLFGGSEKGVAFVFAFIFLVLAPALVGAWALLKFWISYALFLKERLTRIYLAELNKRGMPSAAGHFDGQSYLGEVASDETETPLVRVKAAIILGELQAAASVKPFSLGIGANSAFENAMSQYQAAPKSFATMSDKAMENELAAELEEQILDDDDPYFTPR